MAPIVPNLVFLPMANSAISNGIDHANRKSNHPIINDPPPLAAASRGNLQIFPVPTAAPMVVRISPNLDENCSVPWSSGILLHLRYGSYRLLFIFWGRWLCLFLWGSIQVFFTSIFPFLSFSCYSYSFV